MRLFLLVLLSLLAVCGLSFSSNPDLIKCPKEGYCSCRFDARGHVIVSCDLSKSQSNVSQLKLPNNTRTLDLSNSNLSRVPTELFIGLSQLTSLSLSRNNIKVIHANAFQGLTRLTFLNLSYNKLDDWQGPLHNELPYLARIDLTGNPTWQPEKLFNISSLIMITGVTWSSDCMNCDLRRFNKTKRPPAPLICNKPGQYIMRGFIPTCKTMHVACKVTCKLQKDVVSHKKQPKQISQARKLWFYAGYAIGSLAIVVNSFVLINVSLSKALRRDLSMILTYNMAACDIMIGCYTIVISNSNIYDIASGLEWDRSRTIQVTFPFCTVASVLNTVGLIVSVVTSLMLTVERYMCIVYCMKPDVRLRMKHVVFVMVTMWIVSLLFALSPEYGFIQLTYSPALMCTMPVNKGTKPTFVIYPLSIITLNYLLMIPMYISIFSVVSHSSTEMRVTRNATMAKRMSVMIGTNFVSFAVPMALLIVYAFVYEGHKNTSLQQPMLHFIVYVWLPVQLLAINSFLNPFLYAFRYRKFQRECRTRLNLGFRLTAQLRRAISRIGSSKEPSSPSTSHIAIYPTALGRGYCVKSRTSRVTESAVELFTFSRNPQDSGNLASCH